MAVHGVEMRDAAALRAGLRLVLPAATSLTVHMCWHDGHGHDYPAEVLDTAGRLRERHCGSGCDDQYMSLTFRPSHADLSDFVRVAPFADLAYACDAAGKELVEVSGEGGSAVVHLTEKQRHTLGQRISAGRRGGILHGAVHRRSARSLTCRSHTGAMVRAVFVFEGDDLSVYPSVESAASCVEANGVDNGEFDFFAEDGVVLSGVTHNEQVTLQETNDRRLADLRDRLRRYLVDPQVGLDPALADNPVAAAQAILDREWERRPCRWFPWLDRRFNGVARLIV